MNKKIQSLAKIIVPILKKNDVVKAGIFGSYARGEQRKNSDIDILVQFKGRKSLLNLVHVKHELEDHLKKRVDVLTYKSLHPLLKKDILSEEVKVL